MKNRLLVSALAAATLVPAMAVAQDDTLSKAEVVDQSADICRALIVDSAPHFEKMRRADGVNGVVRHGRRFVSASRPYVRDLRDLREPEAAVKYRRFVNNTDAALDWLAAALDALDARRGNLARERADRSDVHAARGEAAARRYGLRRPCIRYIS